MNEFEKQLANQPLKSVPPEWRAQILNEARARVPREVPASSAQPLSWLRELLWPNPQAWGALAAVWIVIAVFKFTTPGAPTSSVVEIAKSQVISLAEHRRELSRLLEATTDETDQPPVERPRGARPVDYAFV
jgi:hypothetical protein